MSEEKIAKKIGAKLIKNSGRGFHKGDMKWKHFIVDAKEHKTLVINIETWSKATTDAYTHGAEWQPMILAELPNGILVAAIPFDELERLVEDADNSEHS